MHDLPFDLAASYCRALNASCALQDSATIMDKYMIAMRKLIQTRMKLGDDDDVDDGIQADQQATFQIPGTKRYATGTMCRAAIDRCTSLI
jgi:hypothetical protein